MTLAQLATASCRRTVDREGSSRDTRPRLRSRAGISSLHVDSDPLTPLGQGAT